MPDSNVRPRATLFIAAAISLIFIALMTTAPTLWAGDTTKEITQSAALVAISSTINRYAYAVDEKDREMLLDTFTPDAVLIAEVAHGKAIPKLESATQIADFILKGRETQQDIRRHFVTNFWIEKIEGNHAIVHSYHLIVVSKDGISETRATGKYLDEMVRDADGVWRSRMKKVMLDAPY